MGIDKCDSQTPRAAVWNARGAAAVLLKEEIADPMSGPVGVKAGVFLYIKEFSLVADGIHSGLLGCLKCIFQLRRPNEVTARAEERLERCH